jgi:hypothetical protein
MADAYTPALAVTPRTKVTKIRELPLPGKVLVSIGDKVTADSNVLSAQLPGDLDIIRIADRMGLEADLIEDGLKVSIGQKVRQGDLLCETRTFFGFLTSRLESPVSGEVEFFTSANAHMGLRHPPVPLTVNAYIDGVVVDTEEGKSVTISTDAALVQGIFGVGGESHGKILPLRIDQNTIVDTDSLHSFESQLAGSIIIGGSSFTKDALAFCAKRDVAAVLTGSIDSDTLSSYIGYEIGVSITGDEKVPFPLIITEGFGRLPISQRILDLANEEEGNLASVNGATQVRAGAMRPELIVPRNLDSVEDSADATSSALTIGSKIRMIRLPYFGQFGTVVELPHEPEKVESGAVVRVLRAELKDKSVVTVPRANIELL